MNFTRDPIIETVITPREGCKLVVRSSKNASQEDYIVDSVEVVSFGHSFFYRSQERPRAFLVPVSDYEVLETKETRMVLKTPSNDQSIKIGGGRDAPPRPRENDERDTTTFNDARPAPQSSNERRRDGGRRRRRRGRDRHDAPPQQERSADHSHSDHHADHDRAEPARAEPSSAPEEAKAPSFISKLFPPPQTLIKETLSRYKPAEEEPRSQTTEDFPKNVPQDDDEE